MIFGPPQYKEFWDKIKDNRRNGKYSKSWWRRQIHSYAVSALILSWVWLFSWTFVNMFKL